MTFSPDLGEPPLYVPDPVEPEGPVPLPPEEPQDPVTSFPPPIVEEVTDASEHA